MYLDRKREVVEFTRESDISFYVTRSIIRGVRMHLIHILSCFAARFTKLIRKIKVMKLLMTYNVIIIIHY